MPGELSKIENTRAMWDMCLDLLIPATKQLREKLDVSEIEFRRLAHTATGKAQEVYFYRVLDEIQKAGIALMHWKEFFTDLEKVSATEQQLSRVILEETMDNQSLRCRKLIELLVELILFQGTNSAPYYRDYLLIRELNEYADSQRDRQEFYGHESRNTSDSMRFYFDAICQNEVQVEPSKRWYLDKPEKTKPAWVLRGVRLSTFRARYAQAIKVCEPAEFMCLGKSYLHAYGVSREIHFSPQENSSSFSTGDCLRLADRCILLANLSLIRLAKLMDATAEKCVQNLITINQVNETNLHLVREVIEERHAVGDYVVAHGDLARVIEVTKSKHDFIAYQAVYLGRPPMSHIKEEWFAAFEVRHFIPKSQAEFQVSRVLATLPPEAHPFITKLREPNAWLKRLDEAALTIWQALKAGKLKDLSESLGAAPEKAAETDLGADA